MVNNSLAVFDNTVAYEGLDTSDMVSLDMTARQDVYFDRNYFYYISLS